MVRKAEKEETASGEETTEGKESTESVESMEAYNWERVVDLVQTAFREERLTEEATWQVVLLVTKGKNKYRGIDLVEVMWKVVATILNSRLAVSITFHDFLHVFWACCGTGITTLESKLLQQLAALREEILYVIFLDLRKAYDALDRSR